MEYLGLSSGLYLLLMLGTITILVIIIVPALTLKKCDACGARNILDAETCRKCGNPIPDE